MIITDLFNQNSSYAQNIIEKNTLAIDSILDKKKRGAFIDLLKKHKGDTIIPFVALESIPLKNKDSQNTYLWIPDKRSFYGIGKNNTLYYCCDIEREDHENFKVVLYKCLPGGLLQKSKDLLLKFSYRHNRNEIQFSLKNSMNDSKVIFAKNDIPNVLPKNIELAKKLCSVIDFKKHVEDYITDTLNFYNAKTPESKIIVDAPFSNQKNVYEYKINFDDVGTLQSLFSSTDKPAVNSSDFTLQKNLTASLISHLFDQKNLYAKNIVETAMLPLNKILHPHYTFNVKQESPFGAYLKNHHAEELLPFVALESVKKIKILITEKNLIL